MNRADFLKLLTLGSVGTVLARASEARIDPSAPFIDVKPKPTESVEIRRAIPVQPESIVTPPTPAPMGEYQKNNAFIFHGPATDRRIALTFDDGPTPSVTPFVLDELKKRNLKVTFFMIGQRVKASPDLARRVHEEGHEIANHTFTHPILAKMPSDRVEWELEMCQETIHNATGVTPVYFRPPYGAFKKTQGPLATSKNLNVVYWGVDPRDWSRPGVDKITGTIQKETRPGSIILMHDLHTQTRDAVPRVLDELQESNFKFERMSEFLTA
jgi:peptidoglycan/xylan/chitin deacetylase (PgdA/CDA1 family)